MLKILILSLVFPCIIYSQNLNEFWKFDTLIAVNNVNYNSEKKINIFENNISQVGIIRDNLILKNGIQSFNLSKIIPNYKKSELITFEIDSEYIVIKDSYFIYIFNHKHFDNIKFKFQIPSKLYLSNMSIWNNTLYLYDVKFSEQNCKESSQTILLEINLQNQEIKKTNFENIDGIDLAVYGQRKLIDFCKGVLSISDLTTYKIRFYDVIKHNFIDSISLNVISDEWITRDSIPHYDCGIYIASFIYSTFKYRNIVNQIWRSEYINDTTLLVCWTYPSKIDGKDSYRCKYNLYRKRNNKWNIFKKNLTNYEKILKDKFSPENISLYQNYRIIDGNLIKLIPYPIKLINFNSGLTIEDFNKKIEEYYQYNDLESTYIIYKFRE